MFPRCGSAWLLLALFVGGCWFEESTSGICRDQLVVEISRRDRAPLSMGQYRFEVRAGGEEVLAVTCGLGDERADCQSGAIAVSVSADRKHVRLVIFAAPPSLAVAVFRDERLLGQQLFAPQYVQVTPEGPLEDPICLQATIQMEIDGD